MRRWCGRWAAVAIVLAAGCSLSSLDDLQGGTADAADRCVEKVDCSGCQGCAKLCTCTAVPDFDQCYQSCLNEADASAGGSSGQGGSAGSANAAGTDSSGGSAGSGGMGACNEPVTDACNICLQKQCCTELVTCSETPECVEFLECYGQYCRNDPTTQCAMANCASSYSGADEYSALAACAQSSCSSECVQ